MMVRPLRVLIACECSGIVRRAFEALGHDAWSCDLKPAEDGSNRHIVGDVRDLLHLGWDLLIVCHPPCTRLCNSGVRWLMEPPGRLNPEHHPAAEIAAYALMSREERLEFMWQCLRIGAALFSDCWNAPIERVCVENPVMHSHARDLISNYEKPQIVQPHWFGDPQFKATGLYLRGLPPLEATKRLIVPLPGSAEHKAWSRVHRMSRGPNRSAKRSEFFPGLADAMAMQWAGQALEVAA